MLYEFLMDHYDNYDGLMAKFVEEHRMSAEEFVKRLNEDCEHVACDEVKVMSIQLAINHLLFMCW